MIRPNVRYSGDARAEVTWLPHRNEWRVFLTVHSEGAKTETETVFVGRERMDLAGRPTSKRIYDAVVATAFLIADEIGFNVQPEVGERGRGFAIYYSPPTYRSGNGHSYSPFGDDGDDDG